jgi:hypothetical protein
VLNSGYINHMNGEKMMFTSFENNNCESDCITFGENSQDKFLGFGKIVLQSSIQFLKFFLLNHCATIYYPYHSFVRYFTIVCSLIRV